MPNLENLKKQAKRYVRWHRDGRHPVAAVLRGVLPRYAGMSDAQILALPFRLVDAQELVARRSGYSSWQALKQGDPSMNESASRVPYPAQPILMNVEPTLFVTDFARAIDFFTEGLGFKIAFTYGEPPFYGQVARDAALINLRHVDQPVIDRSKERDLVSASIWVSNARQLFLHFKDRGVAFHQPLRREPWHGEGQGGFIVADPDGNLISFGGRTD